VTLNFELLNLAASDKLSFIHPTHTPILYWWFILPPHGTVTAHTSCAVTCHQRGGTENARPDIARRSKL